MITFCSHKYLHNACLCNLESTKEQEGDGAIDTLHNNWWWIALGPKIEKKQKRGRLFHTLAPSLAKMAHS